MISHSREKISLPLILLTEETYLHSLSSRWEYVLSTMYNCTLLVHILEKFSRAIEEAGEESK